MKDWLRGLRALGLTFKCLTTLDLDFIFLEGISFDIKLQVVPFFSFLFFGIRGRNVFTTPIIIFYWTNYNLPVSGFVEI